MSVLIPEIESVSVDDPGLFESPEEEEEAHLDYVLRLIGASEENAQPPIEHSSDILKHWDVLAPQLVLDGAKREVYTSVILQGLSRFECPTGTWVLPRDFEVLT